MIVIVYWVVENNLVYFAQKRRLICDCDSFYFRVVLAWSMIVIVFWAVEINLVYFAQKRWLICDCDSFLGY